LKIGDRREERRKKRINKDTQDERDVRIEDN